MRYVSVTWVSFYINVFAFSSPETCDVCLDVLLEEYLSHTFTQIRFLPAFTPPCKWGSHVWGARFRQIGDSTFSWAFIHSSSSIPLLLVRKRAKRWKTSRLWATLRSISRRKESTSLWHDCTRLSFISWNWAMLQCNWYSRL